jgi:hypothetical protein
MTTTKKEKEVKGAAPQTTSAAPQEAKRGPVKVFRIDDVSAAVFAREIRGMTFYSVSFTRSYKDRDGTWKYTKNFDEENLGRVVTVAQQSAEWIHDQAAVEESKF